MSSTRRKMNILVVGAGMYACGRGTDGYGTIMPAICEWKKTGGIGEVVVAAKSSKGINEAKKKIGKLLKDTGTDMPIKYFAGNYMKAIRRMACPACAIVAVPDNLHREMAEAAIRNGLHTLIAKPLVTKVEEALDLIRIQRERNVYCAVEFHKRLDLANLKLKDTVQGGSIGDPLYFIVEFSQRKSIPTKIFKKWIKSTNVFQYLGVHYADIIYFATGALPKRVMAIGQMNWLRSKGIDAYDSIEAVIEWQAPSGGKFVSCILTNWIDPENTSAMSDQAIKVIGTKGRFESDQKRRGVTIVTDKKGVEEPNPYFCSAYGEAGKIAHRGYGIDSICRFLDDAVLVEDGIIKIEDLEKDRPTFKNAVVPTAVLEAVNKSLAAGGKWVGIGRISRDI